MPTTHYETIYLSMYLSFSPKTKEVHTSEFLLLVQTFSSAKSSAAIHPRREKIHFQNPAGGQQLKKKSREDPVNSEETYGHPRPAPWPGALLRWAAAPAANPQSWTCLDATRHVDSLRQDRKKVFSCSATLQSYTGVWGRVRLSFHSPPDPSRKLPTAYTHFPPGFLYQRLKNWEVLGTGPTGDAPSLTSCCRSRLGKTRMDPSFKRKKTWENEEKKRLEVPPSIISQWKGWSLERSGGGWARRKPDPEEHQRVWGGSPPPTIRV